MDYSLVVQWLIQTSLVSAILIGIISLLRVIVKKKVNPSIIYYMWLIVIVKLILPYGPESDLSIYNIFNNSNAMSIRETVSGFTTNNNIISTDSNSNFESNISNDNNNITSNNQTNNNTTVIKLTEDKFTSQFSTGLMSDKPISLTDNLKEPDNEYFAKYITDKGYKIIINSGMATPIALPKSFDEVIEGVLERIACNNHLIDANKYVDK